jgi:hypothetical protein
VHLLENNPLGARFYGNKREKAELAVKTRLMRRSQTLHRRAAAAASALDICGQIDIFREDCIKNR